jgi:hypothetical protein
MLVTQSPRVTWLDVLFGALLRLFHPQPRPVMRRTAVQPVTDLQLGARPATGYVDVGRRFPIREDRLESFYRAADEDF